MRVLKFRGNTGTNKVTPNGWVYGSLFISTAGDTSISPWGLWHNVWPESIGQFTGLKDKNGVDVYEDDIVRIGHDDVEISHHRIFWDNIGARFLDRRLEDGDSLEADDGDISFVRYGVVIGNIFDNPEYL